jgi:hypothetical protein
MIVYHYTTNESLQLIVNSNDFHPSYLNPQMDTAFGEGWYFTDLPPETTPDNDLQQSLWMRKEPDKCKRYLAFEIDDSLLEYCRPHVYRLRIEAVTGKIIKLNLNYTYTNSGKQAIRFIAHGFKKFINKIINPWKTFGIIALIGVGLWALTK